MSDRDIIKRLREVWTPDRFWQGNLQNDEGTAFCIVGMAARSFSPLPESDRYQLEGLLLRVRTSEEDFEEADITEINDQEGQEAVFAELERFAQ